MKNNIKEAEKVQNLHSLLAAFDNYYLSKLRVYKQQQFKAFNQKINFFFGEFESLEFIFESSELFKVYWETQYVREHFQY